MPRFVLLRHALPDSTCHYDLMLERAGSLATWRIPAPLADVPPEGADAVHLGDHRLHYLTHEGDIGGGRGSVKRVDEGTYEAEAWESGRVAATLKGNVVTGRVELLQQASAAKGWRLRFEPCRCGK